MTLLRILQLLSLYGTLIPFLVGLFLYKKFDSPFKKVFVYAAAAVLCETIARVLSINYYPNTFVYSAFSVVEFFLIIFILYPMLTYKFTKILYILLIAVFVLVYLWCRLFATNIIERIYAQLIAESFCLIFFAGLAMYRIAGEMNERLIKNSRFLFASAVLFFFASNLFVYIINWFLDSQEIVAVKNYLTGIHRMVNFLFHLILTLAMWFNSQRIK